MTGFDISSLLEFRPPGYLCANCYALLSDIPRRAKDYTCPFCSVQYRQLFDGAYTVPEYLKVKSLHLEFRDIVAHSRRLAAIAGKARAVFSDRENNKESGMAILLTALQASAKFVHFSSFGLSHIILGALMMTANKGVPVRGFASNIHPNAAEELKSCVDETHNLFIRYTERADSQQASKMIPHQKVLIIDGLLAFKGSTNLTNDGWRKAAKGLDNIEVVTNTSEVAGLNNRLFSPAWTYTESAEIIEIDDIPF